MVAYEPSDSFILSPKPSPEHCGKPYEIGTLGLWPGHVEYRAVFLLWWPGIQAAWLPERLITGIAPGPAQSLTGPYSALPAQNGMEAGAIREIWKSGKLQDEKLTMHASVVTCQSLGCELPAAFLLRISPKLHAKEEMVACCEKHSSEVSSLMEKQRMFTGR